MQKYKILALFILKIKRFYLSKLIAARDAQVVRDVCGIQSKSAPCVPLHTCVGCEKKVDTAPSRSAIIPVSSTFDTCLEMGDKN